MLKSTTKIDRTKREQNRILLEKKLSKDSVTSTKFCDSSEEREGGSSSSSNASLHLSEKPNITRTLDANNTSSFLSDQKTKSKGGSIKSSRKHSQHTLSKVNILDKGNDYKINDSTSVGKSRRGGIPLDESKISSKTNSIIVDDSIDNQNYNTERKTERSSTEFLNIEGSIPHILSGVDKVAGGDFSRFPRTISFKDNLVSGDGNQYNTIKEDFSYLYGPSKVDPSRGHLGYYNSPEVLNTYPSGSLTSSAREGYSFSPYGFHHMGSAPNGDLKHFSANILNAQGADAYASSNLGTFRGDTGGTYPDNTWVTQQGNTGGTHQGNTWGTYPDNTGGTHQGDSWGTRQGNTWGTWRGDYLGGYPSTNGGLNPNILNSYEQKNVTFSEGVVNSTYAGPFVHLKGAENSLVKGGEVYTRTGNERFTSASKVANEMDFTNMYTSHTPIGSNDSSRVGGLGNANLSDKTSYYVNDASESASLVGGVQLGPLLSRRNVYDTFGVDSGSGNSAPASPLLAEPVSTLVAEPVSVSVPGEGNSMASGLTNGGEVLKFKTAEFPNYADYNFKSTTAQEGVGNTLDHVVKPSELIEREKMKNEVPMCEEVTSHTDYSRATHSSHVVDKRIVHEGFDTIKVPKYREVEIVEKIVEVPVVHKVNKYINKYEVKEVEKVVKKPINKYVETKIEVPEFHFKDKIVEVPELQEVVKIVEKPEIKERIIYKNKIETKIIPKYIEVPVVKIINKYESYDDIGEVIKTVPVKKIVEIPNEVIRKVKVPVRKIIEEPNYVPIIKYRDVPIEKIRYVPKIQTVELVKTIPKVIDIPVPVRVPKIKVIDKPFYINRYVDHPVVVPVSRKVKPVYKYGGKKVIEIPIHKPYIVTHDTVVRKDVHNGMSNGRCSVYARKMDLNAFDPVKRNELFRLVNGGNFNLERSVSVDNFVGRVGGSIGGSIGGSFGGSIGGSTDASGRPGGLHFTKSLNNGANAKVNVSNMNTSYGVDFYSNGVGVANGLNAPFVSAGGLGSASNEQGVHPNFTMPISMYNGNCDTGRKDGRSSLAFLQNGSNGVEQGSNDLPEGFPRSSNFQHRFSSSNPVNERRGGVASGHTGDGGANVGRNFGGGESSLRKYQPSVRGNVPQYVGGGNDRSMRHMGSMGSDCGVRSGNGSGMNRSLNHSNSLNQANQVSQDNKMCHSNTMSNMNTMSSMNNGTCALRSRSPSACSADGISAYVVEYVGDEDRRFREGGFSNGFSNQVADEMGSNYSFSGTVINSKNE